MPYTQLSISTTPFAELTKHCLSVGEYGKQCTRVRASNYRGIESEATKQKHQQLIHVLVHKYDMLSEQEREQYAGQVAELSLCRGCKSGGKVRAVKEEILRQRAEEERLKVLLAAGAALKGPRREMSPVLPAPRPLLDARVPALQNAQALQPASVQQQMGQLGQRQPLQMQKPILSSLSCGCSVPRADRREKGPEQTTAVAYQAAPAVEHTPQTHLTSKNSLASLGTTTWPPAPVYRSHDEPTSPSTPEAQEETDASPTSELQIFDSVGKNAHGQSSATTLQKTSVPQVGRTHTARIRSKLRSAPRKGLRTSVKATIMQPNRAICRPAPKSVKGIQTAPRKSTVGRVAMRCIIWMAKMGGLGVGFVICCLGLMCCWDLWAGELVVDG